MDDTDSAGCDVSTTDVPGGDSGAVALDPERVRFDTGDGEEPPGPDGLPLLGVTLSVIRDQLGYGERMAEEYGDVGRASVAGRTFYGLNNPADIERVLVTEMDAFVKGELTTGKLENLSPNSLLLSEGERWTAIREALQPAFFMEQVRDYADEMGAIGAEITDEWTDGQRLDAEDVARTLTIRVLSRTLFGADVRAREQTLREAAVAVRRRFDTESPAVFLPDWVPLPRIWRYRKATAALDDLVDDLIAARRDDPDGFDDILSELVARSETADVLDHETLKDNAKGLLVAGHDTSAAALATTLGLLACHSESQRRVRDEVADALAGHSDATPGGATLTNLDYTDAVVREALRLYPPAPVLYRETVDPVDVGPYTIPAGVDVSISPWVVHRDERWWDRPETFDPSRWFGETPADDSARERPEYAYFPFGGGPRNCIGARFAMTELKLAVAAICQRVELDTPMEAMPEMEGGMTLSPAEPIELVVRSRTGTTS